MYLLSVLCIIIKFLPLCFPSLTFQTTYPFFPFLTQLFCLCLQGWWSNFSFAEAETQMGHLLLLFFLLVHLICKSKLCSLLLVCFCSTPPDVIPLNELIFPRARVSFVSGTHGTGVRCVLTVCEGKVGRQSVPQWAETNSQMDKAARHNTGGLTHTHTHTHTNTRIHTHIVSLRA